MLDYPVLVWENSTDKVSQLQDETGASRFKRTMMNEGIRTC